MRRALQSRFLGTCFQYAENLASSSALSSSKAAQATTSQFSREFSLLATSGCSSTNYQRTSFGQKIAEPFAAGQQLRTMFIQTQTTPNPSSLMFLPGKPVMESGSYEFPNARAGMSSPLAKRLFSIDGVTAVFFGSEFITVTKRDDADVSWAVLKPDVFAAIMDHYSSGEPMFLDAEAAARSDTAIHPEDDEIVAMIKELLETRIRPAVQEDGGDIQYRSFDHDTGVVEVKLMGACSGCPSSAITLKSGIENMLMHYVPEVKGVIEADTEAEEGGGGCSSHGKADPATEENKLAQMLSN